MSYVQSYQPSVGGFQTAPHSLSSPGVSPGTMLSATSSSAAQTLGQANDKMVQLSNDLQTLYGKAQSDFLSPSSYAQDASQMAKDIDALNDIQQQVGANMGKLTGDDAKDETAFIGDVDTGAQRAYQGLLSASTNSGGSSHTVVAGPINLPLAAAASTAVQKLTNTETSLGAFTAAY